MTRAAAALKSTTGLIDAGLALPAARDDLLRVQEKYAIAVTPAIADLIDRDNPDDPIARQFVPDIRELATQPHELRDPIGDDAHTPVKGIVHRYPDRVLFKVASVCPVYCRFCFRREMIGPEHGEALAAEDIQAALSYIREHNEIGEVIFTGGDPFVLSPRRIRDLTRDIGAIPHVKILRWHTRVPVADPERVTNELVSALTATSKTVIVGVHTNHARELTEQARAALDRLSDAGIALVSQTVLLKGVNDTAGTLEDLMRALVDCRVKPYYLHHGDLAPGTAHFRTTIAAGLALMRELEQRLSGGALPKYVLDIPGGFGKVEIAKHLTAAGNGLYTVRDRNGRLHPYEDCCATTDVP